MLWTNYSKLKQQLTQMKDKGTISEKEMKDQLPSDKFFYYRERIK